MPRTPKPPGTQMPSRSLRLRAAPSGVAQSSLDTHRMLTRQSWWNAPARIASVTDR